MGILALLLPFIPSIITLVEKLFGPKTGAAKLDTSLKMLQPLIDALAAAGKASGPPPSVADLSSEISKTAATLFPSGTTVDPTKGPASPAISSADFKAQIKALILWALNN